MLNWVEALALPQAITKSKWRQLPPPTNPPIRLHEERLVGVVVGLPRQCHWLGARLLISFHWRANFIHELNKFIHSIASSHSTLINCAPFSLLSAPLIGFIGLVCLRSLPSRGALRLQPPLTRSKKGKPNPITLNQIAQFGLIELAALSLAVCSLWRSHWRPAAHNPPQEQARRAANPSNSRPSNQK